jgi:uncharacterized protein (DUF2235 family)
MAKVIALFSDGTGNSAAKLNKTNVWRLYQALDLAWPGPDAAGDRQIALYDNGVGTSSFRPLALLGGVFGYGLERNVLDLYKFLCRNYEPGDRIYAFGFSRGAFTIRVLIGFVLKIGLVPYQTEQLLDKHAQDAYRGYRRGFNARTLAGWMRGARDGAVTLLRKLRGVPPPGERVAVPEVSFVGVWDTVAAYGMPIAEMTRAVDRWIWPLSMPNYKLSAKVQNARHALALDDERDTFHPLLWDEVAEAAMVKEKAVAAGRLKQLWFAGMHSDVGGGYPDDGLSYVSLDWMVTEAAACGLRFKPSSLQEIAEQKNALAPIHDSRHGLGTYYRYQPRRLVARMPNPPVETLLSQDPDPAARGHLADVLVHESVMERVLRGPDGYAPIVLPPSFAQRGNDARVVMAPGLDKVWNIVWRRRINYFAGLAVTLFFLLMPMLPASDCEGPQCLVSPAVSAAGSMLPDFLRPWVTAWADNPAWFIVLVAAMAWSLRRGRSLQRSIDDAMSDVWRRTLAPQPGDARSLAGVDRWIHGLRASRAYQRSLQYLKWRAAPTAFAVLYFYVGSIALLMVVHRVPFAFVDVHRKYCASAATVPVGTLPAAASGVFQTKQACWPTGLAVEKDAQYRLTLAVVEPWKDGSLPPATPAGFGSAEFGYLAPFVAPLRRSLTANWFSPVLTLRDSADRAHTFPVPVLATQPPATGSAPTEFTGTFTAPVSGQVFLFVNDVVLPWRPESDPPLFYANNAGSATVTLQRLAHSNPVAVD